MPNTSTATARKPTHAEFKAAINGKDSKLSTFSAIADALDVPLWVLFVPGLKDEDMRSPRVERLIALVEAYARCDDEDRYHIERMAAMLAHRGIRTT